MKTASFGSQQLVYIANEGIDRTVGLADIWVEGIGNKLSYVDLVALNLVGSLWNKMIQPHLDNKLLEKVSFGKDKWLSIPGIDRISEPPTLTEAQKNWVITKLKGDCVFFNEPDPISEYPHRFQNDKIKKLWQTHRLIS